MSKLCVCVCVCVLYVMNSVSSSHQRTPVGDSHPATDVTRATVTSVTATCYSSPPGKVPVCRFAKSCVAYA